MKKNAAFLVTWVLVEGLALAGLSLNVETRKFKEGSEKTYQGSMKLEGKNLLLINDRSKGDAILFRGEENHVVTLNPESRTAFQIDKGLLQAVNSAMAGLQERMAGMECECVKLE